MLVPIYLSYKVSMFVEILIQPWSLDCWFQRTTLSHFETIK